MSATEKDSKLIRPTHNAAILAVTLLMLLQVGPVAMGATAQLDNSKLKTMPSSEAKGQNSKLIEGVRAGFGDTGAYVIGEWVPVRVTLANPPGGADRRVRVEINSVANNSFEVLSTYASEVDLPAQSRKVVTLYTYTTSFIRELEVRVLDGNRVVESTQARLEPYQGRANVLVGVASSDPSLLNALNGELVGHPEDPPDPAYGSSRPQSVSSCHLYTTDAADD
jgi:hypothetical protein